MGCHGDQEDGVGEWAAQVSSRTEGLDWGDHITIYSLQKICLLAKRSYVFSSYQGEGGSLSFNHKSTHKYSRIIPLLDKNGFYLEACEDVALLKSWPTHLSLFPCGSGLSFSGFSFKGMLSLLFSKAHAQTKQRAELAISSQEGFEESVDVSGLAVYIKYAGAGALVTTTSQIPRSPEG